MFFFPNSLQSRISNNNNNSNNATLHRENVELLEKADSKSQKEEQQLQTQQASMQMQLTKQARVETEKFGKAVQEMAVQFSARKGQLQIPTLQAKQQFTLR